MRAIWKGHISFALVTIPVSVLSATRSSDVGFKYLHKTDLSPVAYKRFCEAEGSEVPWDEITKGYEFEKGRFVEVTADEFKQANAELSRTIQVIEFIDQKEIDPVYFDKPYFLEPQKGGERPYALMRDALAKADRVALARVVLKSREHLAAVRPTGALLTMQMLRFEHELVDSSEVKAPQVEDLSAKEMELADTLIGTMIGTFEPSQYRDQYRQQLLDIIQKKVEGVAPVAAGIGARAPANVVDLMEVLKRSLEESKKGGLAVHEKTIVTSTRRKPGKKVTSKAR
jgi:DNA end-binding protein Ku